MAAPSGSSPTTTPDGFTLSHRAFTTRPPEFATDFRWNFAQDLLRFGPISGRGAFPSV